MAPPGIYPAQEPRLTLAELMAQEQAEATTPRRAPSLRLISKIGLVGMVLVSGMQSMATETSKEVQAVYLCRQAYPEASFSLTDINRTPIRRYQGHYYTVQNKIAECRAWERWRPDGNL